MVGACRRKETILVLERTSTDDYGVFLWPCGELLAWFLWKHPDVVHGRTVLELGAGVGLPGLLAARLGAKFVSLTDRDRHIDNAEGRSEEVGAIANAREAVRMNDLSSNCKVFPLSWGCFDDNHNTSTDTKEHFDVLLAADCFYSSSHFDDVLATVHYYFYHRSTTLPAANTKSNHTQLPSHNCCYVAYQERSSNRNIRLLLPKWRLKATTLSIDFMPEELADAARFSSLHLFLLEPC